jgi:hypothetical protein
MKLNNSFEIKLPTKKSSSFNRKLKSVNGIPQAVKINRSFEPQKIFYIKHLIPKGIL